jgi:hypothetical protein
MRWLLISAAVVCFVCGIVCFGLGYGRTLRFIFVQPAVEDGFSYVAGIPTWAWRAVAFFVAGFTILWFTPAKVAPADRGA